MPAMASERTRLNAWADARNRLNNAMRFTSRISCGQGNLSVDDVLAIDEDGDFHVFPQAKKGSIKGTVNGKKIINSFFFGPILVQNSRRVVYIDGEGMAQHEPRQRMAIAQVGPLHYKCICCATHARGSMGMKLDQFANLVAKQGVRTAYNLDGGNSCMMIFGGEKINDPDNPDTRDICDIIYFASAWPGEKP